MSDDGVSRRELLKKVGLGGAVFLGGSVLGRTVQSRAEATGGDADYEGFGIGAGPVHDDGGPLLYGGVHSSPTSMGPNDLDSHTLPPAPDGQPAGAVREIELAVEERLIEVAADVFFEAWTYNGTVPGPIIRATEGDTVRINFKNRTGMSHNLHFHGAHRPEQDGQREAAVQHDVERVRVLSPGEQPLSVRDPTLASQCAQLLEV